MSRKRKNQQVLRDVRSAIQAANVPASLRTHATASEDFVLAAADGEKKGPRKFAMTAYTGAQMVVGGFWRPVVVDLSGLSVPSQRIAILKDHDTTQIVGHTEEIEVSAQRVKLSGAISGVSDSASEVMATADNGFPWQASIGASVQKSEFVEAGSSVTVNGRKFTGPITVIRAASLHEVSFVALGADPATSAKVAAELAAGGETMTFEQWLAAKFPGKTFTDQEQGFLKAAYEAEQNPPAVTKPAKTVKAKADPSDDDSDDDVEADLKASRKAKADESRRVAKVTEVCAGKHGDIEAKAIEEGWTVEKTELEVLRASRPKSTSPGTTTGGQPLNGDVIRAAVAQSLGLRDLEKSFKPEVLQAAHTAYKGRLSLQQMLLEAAWAGGYDGRHFDAGQVGIKSILKAAFSTMSLPGIFADSANKFLLQGFMAVESVWQRISSTRSVKDFRTVTSYRLTGAFQFDKIGPTGELHHGSVDEESFTNQADTYGKMFAITRTDIINDDLGALSAIPMRIGRGAALKLNDVFWTEFVADHSTFFPTDASLGNYFEGASSNLQSSSLATGLQKFRDQTDPDGKPLGVDPRILLVPTALEVTAAELMQSTNINTGGSSTTTKVPNKNIWAGRFEQVVSAYLGHASYGNSSTAFYLLADPADLSMIEVAFLNGQQQPTVESAEADFNVLGVQMRGYFDFGVNKQDHRAAVKSKGAA
jgi:hypothetical protein